MPLPENDFLNDYYKHVFIETGSHHGDAIAKAIEFKFKVVYSTEINPIDYGWCMHRFWEHRANVHLYNQDSREFLTWLLPMVTTACTFWLDAHWCNTEGGNKEDVPLLEELKLIKAHELNTHNILIDDVRLFGQEGFPTMQEVSRLLRRINKKYTLSLENSRDFPKDILVAHL